MVTLYVVLSGTQFLHVFQSESAAKFYAEAQAISLPSVVVGAITLDKFLELVNSQYGSL